MATGVVQLGAGVSGAKNRLDDTSGYLAASSLGLTVVKGGIQQVDTSLTLLAGENGLAAAQAGADQIVKGTQAAIDTIGQVNNGIAGVKSGLDTLRNGADLAQHLPAPPHSRTERAISSPPYPRSKTVSGKSLTGPHSSMREMRRHRMGPSSSQTGCIASTTRGSRSSWMRSAEISQERLASSIRLQAQQNATTISATSQMGPRGM